MKPLAHFVSGNVTLQILCPLFSQVLAKVSITLLHVRIVKFLLLMSWSALHVTKINVDVYGVTYGANTEMQQHTLRDSS